MAMKMDCMPVEDGWTVVRTLDELPDQTVAELYLRPKHVFPLPEDCSSVTKLIPDEVLAQYKQLMQQRKQRDTIAAAVEAMRDLQKVQLTDGERRRQKQLERLREKLIKIKK